jgi:citrate synthase
VPERRKEQEAVAELIAQVKKAVLDETGANLEPEISRTVNWPIPCNVGPGLEGAIACESKVGYVNGSKGWLVYRGYDIFDLCAHSSYEEVSFLLLHGHLPTQTEFETYQEKLWQYRDINQTIRLLMSFPVERLQPMAALRLGTNLMRQKQTYRDMDQSEEITEPISADEDSIPMETMPLGATEAVYQFPPESSRRPAGATPELTGSEDMDSCYHLISGVAVLAAAIVRLRAGKYPLEPRADLSHAANFLYMITGKVPTPLEERIMDINLILHADHGMNASTFATMVVASTLSDIYFSVGSGISALNGPLHGGANEQVVKVLEEIGSPDRVDEWYDAAVASGRKVPGFGHRVYKAYDPRARILAPLARRMAESRPDLKLLFETARRLEERVVAELGRKKSIFPNVDFYSGILYKALDIPEEFFTPLFAVSRTAGWTARVMEYLQHNRIFRPRAVYTGDLYREYAPLEER